jgi:hypothetical protein
MRDDTALDDVRELNVGELEIVSGAYVLPPGSFLFGRYRTTLQATGDLDFRWL